MIDKIQHARIVRACRRCGYKMTKAARAAVVAAIPTTAVYAIVCRQGKSHRRVYGYATADRPNPVVFGLGWEILEVEGVLTFCAPTRVTGFGSPV